MIQSLYEKRYDFFFFVRKPNSMYDRGTLRSLGQEIKKGDKAIQKISSKKEETADIFHIHC
jgi:hypothetical protein